MKKFIIIAIISISLSSCGAAVTSSFTTTKPPLSIDNKVAFLDIQNMIPEGAIKLGNANYGDSGFSTDCSFDTNLINARKLARSNGANIVKITWKSTPDLLSSCYRIKVDFYNYAGDVSLLNQYHIQIN